VLLDGARTVPTELGPLSVEVWLESLGQRQHETALIPPLNHVRSFDSVQVPEGHVLVLGDSRDNSADSRFIGFIDVQRITGRAERVAMSHNPQRFYVPRAQRWWLPLESGI
jgi:signal peptidase I